MTSSDLSQPPSTRSVWLFCATLLALVALAALAAPRASAISDAEELTRFGGQGSGAGELSFPNSIATDPVTGHLFTVEEGNNRISEFTPWGNFVKAFGWDVAPGAVNEQQEVRVRASTGQFKLSFGASTTPDLAFNAPGSEDEGPGSVEAALNALPSIGGAGGEVSVKAVPAPPGGKATSVYVVAFKGSLAATNVVDELTIANGTTSLDGGVPSTTFEVRTRADGTGGGTELESCTAESGCQAGLKGAGAGQLSIARGIAVDSAGNVYAREVNNLRVQKFDSAGRFALMFGGEVNKTTSANRCTKADIEAGDVCGIGVAGAANGQFGSLSHSIVVGPGGKLFAGDIERIQRFNLEGEWEASVPVSGKTVNDLAIAPGSGDFYATVAVEEDVHILDATTGAEKGKLQANELKNSQGAGVPETKATGGPIAVDPDGNAFIRRIISLGGGWPANPLLQFDATGKQVSEFGETLPVSVFPGGEQLIRSVSGLTTNAIGDLYVTSQAGTITAFGPGPVSFEAPPPAAPTIIAQFATSVERTGAVLSTEINPHFWSEARFYIEYGTGKCSEGGCTSQKPLSPGASLGSNPVDAAVKSTGIFLEDLKPGTTYHYRFVVESLGGGPVRGIGGEVGADGEESAFTTYPAQSPGKADCPNQGFRTGFSAPLPDCRAFEMVSPIDKNNGDIKALLTSLGLPTALTQSSTDGDRFTYTSVRAFADPLAGPYSHQYLAERTAGVGWKSQSLMPPQGVATVSQPDQGTKLDSLYKAFSDDLCEGWISLRAEPPLVPPLLSRYPNVFRRDTCGTRGFEPLVGVEPTDPGVFYGLMGVSADGEDAVLVAKDKLTPDAASGVWQTYLASEGQLRLICVLPNGSPSGGNCSGGTGERVGGGGPASQDISRLPSVVHALSTDGSHAYWTASTGESGPGKVYLRLNPGAEQSAVSGGECTEAEKACTLKVSETASTKDSRFLGASADGSKALFEVTEGIQDRNLYLFDQDSPSPTLIAGETKGVAGASEDLSRVYFVSEEALGVGAKADEPNLYLSEEGTVGFIATLSDAETFPQSVLFNTHFTDTASEPILDVSRVSPDGGHIAFVSTESPTGYDNTDQVTGEADSEVYLYEAGAAGPVCVSCNPSGARPVGREVRAFSDEPTATRFAAMISPAQFTLHYPRSLSDDGKHVFFNSYDALLPRDTNGKADVYEWQAALGEKECQEKGADLYVQSSGGCLSLISSGQSPNDSEFLDATPDGRDVFLTTQSSLLPQDPGLIDVYDAREGGGLPGPQEPPGPCQGEACQIAPPPPNDPTPSSASFKGAGNLKPTPRCRKGKVARKGRCVAKKRKAAKRKAAKRETNHNRRAGR